MESVNLEPSNSFVQDNVASFSAIFSFKVSTFVYDNSLLFAFLHEKNKRVTKTVKVKKNRFFKKYPVFINRYKKFN